MIPDSLFKSYEILAAQSDHAFESMREQYAACVRCVPGCSDCCHALFGLFLIEAAYLRMYFEKLGREKRREAAKRARRADKGLERLKAGLQGPNGNQEVKGDFLASHRLRCPLLDDTEGCVLYPHRPITCRVYGVPNAIHGKAHVCGKAAFRKGESYPAFDLDGANRNLYRLSVEYLQRAGGKDPVKASLLVSVSKAVTTPTRDLIREVFQ